MIKKVIVFIFSVLLVFGCGKKSSGVDDIQFMIPGGVGGGWDMTARAVGDVLMKEKLIKKTSFVNISGGGGGTAIGKLIKEKKSPISRKTLLVNSTPILVRSLTKVFPFSYKDIVPVAGVISDNGAIVSLPDSPYQTWDDVKKNVTQKVITVAGGSALGDLDNIALEIVIRASGLSSEKFKYIPYDAGGKAFAALLSKEVDLLVTGLGEVINQHKDNQIHILGHTGKEDIAGIKSFVSMGYPDAVFVNWRGFFAAPGTSKGKVMSYNKILKKMMKTKSWKEVQTRNGWINSYMDSKEFSQFLDEQNEMIKKILISFNAFKE